MARIRTIKPDFWTDETLTECSLSARLLFIGTFNFADDNGNLEASAKQLKMKVFPADNIDCAPLLDELIAQGLLIEYSVSGVKYLNIKGFKKHQVINRPSKTNIPDINMNDNSVNTHGVLIDGREGKGREGNITTNVVIVGNGVANCPHEEIIQLYAKHLPMLTQVKTWTEARAKVLKTRWRESAKHQTLEFWDRYFKFVSESDFLSGRNGKWTSCDMAWLIKQENFVKVLEGKYHGSEA